MSEAEYDEETGEMLAEAVVEEVELEPARTVRDQRPSEDPDLAYKWVKSSILEGPIMAKVVQELMARVEALEAV